ncbi:MAG: beta-propeller domain-containing protein [Polyangiaceae bacterium]
MASRFGEKAADTGYLASGMVPGHVLNQFSMDEYQGALRIATSKGRVPDPKVESVMSVLAQEGSTLSVIGQISGIAPTEDIRSVRFQGKRGYLVTFKKTDPLFVLNFWQIRRRRRSKGS